MANLARTVEIILNGKDQMSPAVRRAVASLELFETTSDSIVSKIDSLADKFKVAAVSAAGIATALGVFAVDKFKTFESAWIDLEKITDEGAEALDSAEDQVKELAFTYGESMVSITRSTVDFKRAGFTLTESLKLVEGGLKLASAGNVEMATSTEFLIAIMKGFNFELEDSGRIVDVLNIISDKYATNVEELGVAISRIAPTAKTAGLTLEETAALATPIIEVFRSGEEAGTALRRGLIKLTDDAKPVRDALRSLGVDQHQANGQLRSGKEILFDIAEGFGTATAGNKLFIASQLFGQRQAAKMIKVLENWNYVVGIETVARSADFQYTMDQVNLKLASTEVAINRTTAALEYMGITVGEKLKPGFESALSGIADLLASTADAVSEGLFDDLFDLFTDLGGRLGDLFAGIGQALPEALRQADYSGFLASINSLLKRINVAFRGIDLTNPQDLAEVIQWVIDSMESGVYVAEGMIDVYDRLKNIIIDAISVFNDLDMDSKKLAGSVLAIADNMDRFGHVFGLVVSLFESSYGIMEPVINTLAVSMKTLASVTRGVYYDANEANREAIIKLIEYRKNIKRNTQTVKEHGKAIKGLPDKVTTAIDVSLDEGVVDKKVDQIADRMDRRIKEKQIVLELAPAGDLLKEEHLKDYIEFTQGKGKYSDTNLKSWTDKDLAYFEDYSVTLKRDMAATNEALGKLAEDDKELKVPDTEKFKAAQAQLLEEIKTNADIMTASFETASKKIEADAQTMQAAIEATNESFTSTGDLLSTLYQQLSVGDLGIIAKTQIESQIQAEEQRRIESFELQKKLTEAQISLMERRAEALESGEPIITVSGDGLQPHLEAFMWEILSAIQVRVNEDHENFLLGVGT